MSLILIPRGRTRQPQSPTPPASGILIATAPAIDRGGALASKATGLNVRQHGPITWVSAHTSIDSYVRYDNRLSNDEITFVVLFRHQNTSGLRYLFGTNYDGESEPIVFRNAEYGYGVYELSIYPGNSSNVTPVAALGDEMLAVIRVGKALQSSLYTLDVFNLTNNTRVSTSFTANGATRIGRPLYLGCGANGSSLWRGFDGYVSAFAVIPGFIPDSKILERYNDPWQIFKPKSRVLYFDTAAPSAAPTLSFPLATSITSTSVVPQVTLTFA